MILNKGKSIALIFLSLVLIAVNFSTVSISIVEASASKEVIVFIPALQATELFKDEGKSDLLWIDANSIRTGLKNVYRHTILQSLHNSNVLYYGEVFGWEGTTTRGSYDTNIYGPLQNYFQDDFIIYTFPYDWRKNNREHTARLKEYIKDIVEKEEVQKVNIVAHSMGGLIAKKYILENKRNHHVDKLSVWGHPILVHQKHSTHY